MLQADDLVGSSALGMVVRISLIGVVLDFRISMGGFDPGTHQFDVRFRSEYPDNTLG
jgi:hypothetical protein